MKDGVHLRSKDPQHKINWDAFDAVDRQKAAFEHVGQVCSLVLLCACKLKHTNAGLLPMVKLLAGVVRVRHYRSWAVDGKLGSRAR